MAMQFERGNLTLRIDDQGLFLHNQKDNGNIQLTPEEGNHFVYMWAMSQAALSAHASINGHLFTGEIQFMPPPEDEGEYPDHA